MKRIVYSRPDGGVSVVTPVNSVEEAMKRLPEDAISPRVVDAGSIPKDRAFRGAWKADLSVDMGKAREIHRNRLRALRKPKLAALDAEYMKALEAGDAGRLADIAARKQALRDVPADPAIEGAQSPDELKAVLPSALL